jgi:hypothetical protein
MAAKRRINEYPGAVNEHEGRVNEHEPAVNEHRPGIGRVVDDAAVVDGVRVPLSLFDGHGRAVPRRHNGRDYVLISAGNGSHLVATSDRWRDHMSHTCQTVSPHTGSPFTLRGWQCTAHA